jgi:peptidyl-dipeptidase A
MTSTVQSFLKEYEARIKPVYKDCGMAAFRAAVSGKEEDYTSAAELELILQKMHADKEDFNSIEYWLEHEEDLSESDRRQLEMLYNAYKSKQFDPDKMERIVQLQNEVEKKFSVFRVEVDGKSITDNEVERILKTSLDSEELRKVWEASKQVGGILADDVRELVRLRNESAREIGYENYHSAQLLLDEQDPVEIDALFDELDELTRDAFAAVKKEMDATLAKRYSIPESELMPWHYQNRFFQEAPAIYDLDLDEFYKDKDLVALTRDYYDGIGLPIDPIIERSDLFEKEGKNPHAFCIDIDREGDVRVFCNVIPNASWMNTMLHEYGHAVYDVYHDKNTAWVLREPAHTFTTEAIAMLFGRFASQANWLKDAAGMSEAEAANVGALSAKTFRLEQLVFCRWVQVMYRFERAMYTDPGQDLNDLWWSLVEKYQMIRRPHDGSIPGWASKIHVALYPAYYHNYMLGELLASQLYNHIARKVLEVDPGKRPSFAGEKAVGQYLTEQVFIPGRTKSWDKMIELATGEALSPKHYAEQVIG